MERQHVVVVVVVVLLLSITGKSWEVKTLTGESYSPPRHSISLQEHTAAFSTSSYCVERAGGAHILLPNRLVRNLCDQCVSCVWKRREGFTTEDEWQTSVTTEMARLAGYSSSSNGLQKGQQQNNKKEEELVGLWVVEAPHTMRLNEVILEELGSNLGVSLRHLVISREEGGVRPRRFFVVSGTPRTMETMLLEAGFSSLTAIPPRLKVDPIVEEGAAAAKSAFYTTTLGTSLPPPRALYNTTGGAEKWGVPQLGLHVEIVATSTSSPSPRLRSSASSSDFNNATIPSCTLLSTAWAGNVASRLGHSRVTVEAESDRVVSVDGLSSAIETYRVALDLAMHGEVEWISPKLSFEPNNYYASKIVQNWPPGITAEQYLPPASYDSGEEYLTSSHHSRGGYRRKKNEAAPSAPRQQQRPSNVTTTATLVEGVEGVVLRAQKRGSENQQNGRKKDIWHSHLHDIGILGQNAVVGVADKGLDYHSCFFSDEHETPTFKMTPLERCEKRRTLDNNFDTWESKTHRKLRQYVAFINNGADYYGNPKKERAGHGTHVCGSVVGNPASSPPSSSSVFKGLFGGGGDGGRGGGSVDEYSGVAPEAKLAFFDTYIPRRKIKGCSSVPGFPVELHNSVFPHAYRVGARVYSISIGENANMPPSLYSIVSKSLDTYCYENQDFIVLVAAGNDGDLTNNPAPRISVRAPASSKNAVAVGAHHNLRQRRNNAAVDLLVCCGILPEAAGGGEALADIMVHLAHFSSRGPTLDGRIKPDICAPGKKVYSAKAGRRPGSKTCDTVGKAGTSMATPIVTGVTVLVRQYFTEGYYPFGVKDPSSAFVPMGALLKAILVNSGRPLLVHPTHDQRNSFDLPNNDQGWGGLDISTTIVTPSSPADLALKVYGEWSEKCRTCPEVYDDETWEFTLKITERNRHRLPLKVTLVWFEKQSHQTAVSLTINDLDLSVTEEVRGGGGAEETTRGGKWNDEGDEGGSVSGGRKKQGTSESPNKQPSIHYPNGKSRPDQINTVEHVAIPFPQAGGIYTVRVKGSDVPLESQYFALVISGPFYQSRVKESLVNQSSDRWPQWKKT